MANLKFSQNEKNEGQEMIFSKSMTFDDEDLSGAAAAQTSDALPSAQTAFIENLKAGDAEAFDILITRYSADIYGLLFRLTADVQEAQDLTQETFLNALRSIGSFRGDANLKTWLFRIAVNQSRNRFRWWKRRRKSTTVSLDAAVGDSSLNIGDTIADKGINPEEAVMLRQREDALAKALNDIPDIFRETVILCDIQGMSYEEIARTLDINLGTVKSRLARGRDDLRRRLKDF
jgi:RNA polymerase sigma-70 factor (ECF subfamily)